MQLLSESRTGATSRVVAYAGGGGCRLEERPRPRPGEGELLLRLICCGLCGTDLFKLGHNTVAPGAVLGHELVGTVEEVGSGVRGFAAGDRVVSPHHVACGECALCRRGDGPHCPAFRDNQLVPGGFAEHVRVGERAVRGAARRLPDAMREEVALFLEPAACVLRGVERAGLPQTRPALAVVLGSGGMGLLHLLVLRALRPELRLLVVDPLAERRALALRLGADAAAPPGAVAAADAERLSDRLGADAVFDTVGGGARLEAGLALCREGGTVVLFAHAAERERAGFELNPFFKGERRLIATYSGALGEQDRAWELLTAGRLDPSPLVTHRLPLSRFAEAVALSRRHQALKVLLVPDA